LLLLAGSVESHAVTKGGFQELDAISLLNPHVKAAIRPADINAVPLSIREAFRASIYGRPGTGFIDLPGDLITSSTRAPIQKPRLIPDAPRNAGETKRIQQVINLFKNAKAPLIVIGKGAAYARAEKEIRQLVNNTKIPFLPTPMGKGVVPDSHPLNISAARSTALKNADVVLILGARLNWILHYGEAPKWKADAKFIQVDISAEELGRNAGDAELAILGDVKTVVSQLVASLESWRWDSSVSNYASSLEKAKEKNEAKAKEKAAIAQIPLKYEHTFSIIKSTIDSLSSPTNGDVVYVSEGANTMDISRSIFTVEEPRLKLDAGTHATMGVGLGYAIAAHAAYNTGEGNRKKIIAIEGDSAFGFSAMELETMARYGMDILVFVINNGGIYHGDSDSLEDWQKLQDSTFASVTTPSNEAKTAGLRSTSLSYETHYENIATAVGGVGYLVRTPEELKKATEEGFKSKLPVVVNVIIDAGKGSKLEFGWQSSAKKSSPGDSKL
jgi:2-hydroxyacyl-CoA lyase 1